MRAIVVVGMGLGDEAKGATVDYLVRQHNAHTVVRYNGGAQAQHRVVLEDGREHIFSQFGSGTLVPGVKTFLSRYMMVNPMCLFNEEEGLASLGVVDALERLWIDSRAPVTTPFHMAANRLKAALEGHHGTTGMGIGETASDWERGDLVTMGMLRDKMTVEERLRAIQLRKRGELLALYTEEELRPFTDWYVLSYDSAAKLAADWFEEYIPRLNIVHDFEPEGTTVFEGAQGVLLDETHGFHPFTTWSSTTSHNARLLAKGWGMDVETIGVMRAYATRHGDGPLVTQSRYLSFPEPEVDQRFAGRFRVGHTDLVTAQYAAHIEPVDSLAITHMDRIKGLRWQACSAYRWRGSTKAIISLLWPYPPEELADILSHCYPINDIVDPEEIPHILSEAMGAPIHSLSYGPTAKDRKAVE